MNSLESLPSAKVRPSVFTNSSSDIHSHITRDLAQGYRATEILLEEVPNGIFGKWAAELNTDHQWSKLLDIMELSRKQFKELRVKRNPGEEILDILCKKTDFTVEHLLHLLECAKLTSVLHTVRQTLETGILMHKHDKPSSTNEDYGPQIKNSTRHTTTETTINATTERPVDNSIRSTCDDEEVQQTEHVVKGAEGVSIYNLNTTHNKFEAVNQVHIYLGNEIQKTNILEETNAEVDIDLFNQEMSEENTTPHLSTKRGDPKFSPSTECIGSEIRSDGQEMLSQNNPAKKSSPVMSSTQNNPAEGNSPVISSVHSIVDEDQEQTPLGNNHFPFRRGLYFFFIICRQIYLDKN